MFCSWLLLFLGTVVALFVCGKKKNKAATQNSVMLSPGAAKQTALAAKEAKTKDKSKEASNKVATLKAKKTEEDEEKKGDEKKEKKEETPEKNSKKKKEEKGGDKKKEAEKIIQDAIKAGDLLPPDDNETINDCESNWGAGVKEDRKK